MVSSNSTVHSDLVDLPVSDYTDYAGSEEDFQQAQAKAQNRSGRENLLSEGEALELGSLEAAVERGLRAFWEIGQALRQIRDKRLYRQEYATFEDYCINRWEMSRRSAYQLIDAASVYENVRPGAHFLPANERQVRPLAALPPKQQQEAWGKAVSTAPSGKVTAVHVAQIVREYQRSGVGATGKSKNTQRSEQKQSTDNSTPSITRSCWNCSHCSRELLDDPQNFYCYQFGKLNFIEKDGNERGAECQMWTYRWEQPDLVKKTRLSNEKTFTLTLHLPAYLQPQIQDAAKASGLVVVDWATKVLEKAVVATNAAQSTQMAEGFIEVSVSEVSEEQGAIDTEPVDKLSKQTAVG